MKGNYKMFITYDRLVKLGNDYGRINFKGWTISGINECIIDVFGEDEIKKANDEELHSMIKEGMHEWECQDEYAKMMQDSAREWGWDY